MADTSWADSLPEVVDHPAAGAVTAATPATADTSWAAGMPEVTEHPALMAPTQTQQAAPTYPVSGPTGNWLTDIPRRLGTAVVDAGVGAISPLLGHGTWSPQVIPGKSATTPDEARANAFNALGATAYQPETLGGRIGQAALTGGVQGLINPASIPSMMAGSATGELAGEALPNHPTLARMLGFIPGAFAGNLASNATLPAAAGSMDAQTATLANAATKDYGIPLAPGQISGNPFVRYFYSETGKLPFSGAESYSGSQNAAFTKAVSQTMGEDSEKITPEVLQQAKSRIGGMFNGVAQRTSIPMNNAFMNDLQNVVTNAKLNLSADSVAPIERQAMNIIDTAANNGGNIGGRPYIDLTAKGGPLDTMMQSGDSGIRNFGTQLRGVIDNHLLQNAAPEDVAALQQARSQWKAMRTIEPLTLRADAVQGATPSTGEISPAVLRAAVNKSYQNAAFAPLGQIPLNDLAKIGQRFLKEPPDSGTPTRALAQHAVQGVGGLASVLTAHELGLPMATAAAGTVGTLAANRVAQSLLRSPMIANRMIRAGMNPNGFRFTYPWMLQGAAANQPSQLPFSLAPQAGASQ